MGQRLIDANELLGLLDKPTYSIGEVLSTIATLDAIDPVHAAGGCRCGECKYYAPVSDNVGDCEREQVMYLNVSQNSFCSQGERREQNA